MSLGTVCPGLPGTGERGNPIGRCGRRTSRGSALRFAACRDGTSTGGEPLGLKLIGAGLGRTGTMSLKRALERLLGGPCYHMHEVGIHAGHIERWRAALRGQYAWEELFEGYVAAVDWPAAAFWRELGEAYPGAPVLLSYRDPEDWWRSASSTIFPAQSRVEGPWRDMVAELFDQRFTLDLDNRERCIDLFEAHNARVRATVASERLIEWRTGDGWGPLCQALKMPVPDEPFPHKNSTEEFQARLRKR